MNIEWSRAERNRLLELRSEALAQHEAAMTLVGLYPLTARLKWKRGRRTRSNGTGEKRGRRVLRKAARRRDGTLSVRRQAATPYL